MESFQKGSGKSQGIEVLYFEDAEISKNKGNDTSFAGFGGLSVLYFKDLNRFVLQLNDWRYPLLRKLNISSSSVKDDPSSRNYVLPAPNGFSYDLKINKVANSQAFENLNTIFDNNSRFSIFGKEIAYRKLEASPELSRRSLNTNPKEIITETVKHVINKVQNTIATLKSGTANLNSRKKKLESKNILNKNFRKEAKSRIQKDFLKSSEKLSNEFLQKRKQNANLSQTKSFDELKKTSDNDAPSLYICKEEVEDAINNARNAFSYLDSSKSVEEEKKGLVTNLREGARNIRDRVSNLVGRRNPEVQGQTESMPLPEDLTHYQG